MRDAVGWIQMQKHKIQNRQFIWNLSWRLSYWLRIDSVSQDFD